MFGLLCVLWLIGKTAVDFWKALQRPDLDADVRAILHGAIAVIIAILAEGFFEYNLGDSEVLTMFLATVACGYAALRVSAGERNAASAIEDLANFRGEGSRREWLGDERRVGV